MKKNDKLVLIGGGGHCKSVLDAVVKSNIFSEVVITDYNMPIGTTILGCRVVGNDERLPELFESGFKYAFIAIGSIKSTDKRRNILLKAREIGFGFPTIIDLSAIVAESAQIGDGVYIGKNAVLNAGTVIDDMAIINTGVIVEHDCRVGEFTHIAVGAVICGEAKIEKDVFIGANATVIEGVKIGKNSIVGAGSVVLGDVPERSKIVGVMKVNI